MIKNTVRSGMNVFFRLFSRAGRPLIAAALVVTIAYSPSTAKAVSKRDLGVGDDWVVENAAEIWDQEGAEWPRWGVHDETNPFSVDHRWWERFMASHSDRRSDHGVIDYVYVANRGLGDLAAYIFALEHVPVSTLPRNEQLAYWLNLHNAHAVQVTALSLTSIADMAETTRHLVLGDPWREKALTVEGERLSLVDIERRIVMRQWKDPRILYGIYLPALGAPGLPVKPFTGTNVWKMLDDRARAFVNSDRAAEFRDKKLHTSALYFWDKWFLPDDRAVLDHLRAFANPALKARLANVQVVTATYLNWRFVSFNSGYDRHQDRQGGS